MLHFWEMISEEQTILSARVMAVFAHGNQRYGDAPYVQHLDDVADLCRGYGTTATVVAYLHDTLEDTDLRADDIEESFGDEVRKLVEFVTDPPGENRQARKSALYSKLGSIMPWSPWSTALVVKAADRLANVRACVAGGNTRLLQMYRDEQTMFAIAVYRPGLNDVMMRGLDELFRLEVGR